MTVQNCCIGVIADTNGLFEPVIQRNFKSIDHILHAGDIGDRSVIEQLEQIVPVTMEDWGQEEQLR